MSKEVFTPEKLRELIKVIKDAPAFDYNEIYRRTEEWLEQNQPAPQVVGLTEKQIKRMVAYIDVSSESLYDDIVTFLETQTFAQPEAKEVPVGLSDIQVSQFVDYYGYGMVLRSQLREWLPNQTFTQQYKTDGFAEMQLEEFGIEYRALKEEFEQLKSQQDITDGGWRGKYDRLHVDYNLLLAELKEYRIREIPMLDEQCKFKDQFDNLNMEPEQLKAQSTPSWDSAPEWANWLAQDSNSGWYLYESKPVRGIAQWGRCDKRDAVPFHVNPNWIETLQERPKPTPQVKFEVDYIYKGAKYSVQSIGKMKVGSEWVDSVTYANDDYSATYTRTIEDFLAKFKQVQS